MSLNLTAVKPLGNKIFVKLLPLYSGSNALGLTLVDQKKHWDHTTRHAEVLATGPKVLEVIVGDTVIFAGHAGKWVNDPEANCAQDQGVYRNITEDEILAVLEREDDKACARA